MATYDTVSPNTKQSKQAMVEPASRTSDTLSTTGQVKSGDDDRSTSLQVTNRLPPIHSLIQNTMDLRTVASDLFLFICLLQARVVTFMPLSASSLLIRSSRYLVPAEISPHVFDGAVAAAR